MCNTLIENGRLSIRASWRWKNSKKNQGRLNWLQLSAAILARWQHLVAFTKALNLLYRVMHTVLYRHTAAAIKMASLLGTFFVVVCLLMPWRPLGQYSSCPMAASSGFRSSPGHAALGNAICITPAHCCGHQNSRQMRCIRSSLSSHLYHNT